MGVWWLEERSHCVAARGRFDGCFTPGPLPYGNFLHALASVFGTPSGDDDKAHRVLKELAAWLVGLPGHILRAFAGA